MIIISSLKLELVIDYLFTVMVKVLVNLAHEIFENLVENVGCKVVINFPYLLVCSAVVSFEVFNVVLP